MENSDPLISKIVAEKYQIIKLIGSGGQGSVYKARHLRLNKKVALKLLRSEYMEDPKITARFDHEAQIASQLEHLNIVRAVDHGKCKETNVVWIEMDYVDGAPLKNLLQPPKESPNTIVRLEVERSINIVIQLCDGIYHAQKKRGVVHRDIKPSNILLTNYNNNPDFVKITDFGIAKVLIESDELKKLTKTEMGKPEGTCLYMAPEQFKEGYTPDFPLDVYSIGCVLFELLTGRPPFKGASDLATINMHMTAPIPDLVLDFSVEPVIRTRLTNIVSKSLAKEPAMRYQTAHDLGADLRKVETRLNQLKLAKTNRALLLIEGGWLSFIKRIRGLFVHLYVQRLTYSKATNFSISALIMLIVLLFLSSGLGMFSSHYDIQYQPVLHKAPSVLPSKQVVMFLLPPRAQLAKYIEDADCERAAGDLRLALELYDKADLKADKIGNAHEEMIRVWLGKVICCLFADRPKLSVSSAHYCFDEFAKNLDGAPEIILGIAHGFCGQALYKLGNKKEAATEFKSFVTILEKYLQHGDLHASDELAYACGFAGTFYAKEGDPALAELLLERAGDYWKSIGLLGKYNLSVIHMNLAFLKIKINQYQEGLDLLENAISDLNESVEINIGLRNKLQLYIVNLRLKSFIPLLPMLS